jgi:hypothetical protein
MLRASGGLDLQRMNDDITLSALVVLRTRLASSRGGIVGRPAVHGPLARESLEVATAFFARKGFAIEDVVGTSFWIMSRPRNFEDLFGQVVEIRRQRSRVQAARLRDGSTEFNLAPLPEGIARHLLAVTFTEPLMAQWLNDRAISADTGAK